MERNSKYNRGEKINIHTNKLGRSNEGIKKKKLEFI